MKKTKQALFNSVIALILCFSMLVGTTFAWFTDEVNSSMNQIVAGNLDVELLAGGKTVDENTELFELKAPNLWEPGMVVYENLTVVNAGTLALKWQMALNFGNENDLNGHKLSEVLQIAIIDEVEDGTSREDVLAAAKASDTKGALSDFYNNGTLEAKSQSETFAVVIFWEPGENDNDYNANNGKETSDKKPLHIEFGIRLQATQMTGELDSFGPDYDAEANFPEIEGGDVIVKVTTDNGLTNAAFSGSANGLTLAVPAGVKTTGNTLTLTVDELATSGVNITPEDGQMIRPLDVHVSGVAGDNTQPMTITIEKAMMKGLNLGNYTLYHVEDGVAKEMELIDANADFTAHNQFKYDPATGDVTLYMATFSEVALVAEPAKWEGNFDYSWYTNAVAPVDGESVTEYTIANADQLAAFGAIVGGMNGQTRDSFSGKTVKLIADINLGDANNANDKLIFHPIGYYYTDDKNADSTTGDYYSTVKSFEGTFDGNGHTIANFYQNTWEIKGDYDGNYYKDAMGLFGYVVNGKVCNLTVDNFSSDGEFTPTGVIAAYAVNSTFENIAITNCNPRVYNTGNGGIVGIGGNSDDPDTYKLTFTNITIDNTNKITALWGSWDVACGGLVGMFRGAGHVYMTNCHVAAQIDVYNDVCGNYQYYWYRYSGMMIGTNKNMTTDANGYTVPETNKFHAEGCTVHFGDWNDYYYCELVANSLASYTHDHQFSRLTEISSLDEIKSGDTWTKTGNFLLISDDTKTCYHIVKDADGTLKQHLHTDAGEETVNGETVLKEDKQIVYLPFNQLFTGYGWGVKHIPVYNGEDYAFEGITILDRDTADSVVKFEKADTAKDSYTTESTVTIGELFKAATISDSKLTIKGDKVQVTISPFGATSTAGGTYVANTTEWTRGTLTFSGVGQAVITITDYYFCKTATIEVTVTERQAEEKFDVVMNNGDFLHRVGNVGTVALDKLFKAKDGVTVGTVSVTVEAINGTGASGTYSNNAIQFSGTGVVKVTITDNDYCIPTELYLEVVDAVNATGATSATSNNVVLLNNISASSLEVSNGYSFYGNGFTITFDGDGSYRSAAVSYGFVTLKNGGTLDNARVICKVFPKSYMFTSEMTAGSDGRYPYGYSAIIMSDNSTVSNCYVYGARNNILVSTGNALITNTVTECGSLSNIQVLSSSSYTITLDNVTTIQYQTTSPFDASAKVLGFGVVVGLPDSTSNATIKLTGDFNQYNWVTAADTSVSNTYTKSAIEGALKVSDYQHTNNAGATTVNTGIAYMNNLARNIVDERTNTSMKYEGNSVSISGYTGYVYSIVNKSGNPDAEINRGQLKNGTSAVNVSYGKPQGDSVKLTTAFDTTTNRWVNTLFLDLDAIGSYAFSFGDLIASKYGINLDYEVKDANGNTVNKANAITLNQLHNAEYTLVVTDNQIYDNKGELTGSSVKNEIVLMIHATKTSIEPPNFTGIGSGTAIRLYEKSLGTEYWRPAYDALTGISVSYWSASTGTTVTVDLSTLNALGTINGNVWTYTCNDYTLTITGGAVHSDGTTITPCVAGNKLYFASMNKHFGTGTPSRDIILTYIFEDTNASKTEEFKKTVLYSDLAPYVYSDFEKGELTSGTGSSGGGGSNPCVTPDTLVTLADGTQKRIDQVTYEDQLLVWNFYTGEYDVAPASIVMNHGYDNYTVVTLNFADGTSVNTINGHGFFDASSNKYVILNESNAADYIGHEFVKVDANGYTTTKLVSYSVKTEYTESWSILTAEHYNCILEGMWTITPAEVEGSADYLMPFEVGEGMKFDEAKMLADIEKYGLYTYEDFAAYCTYEQFMGFGLANWKVAVGKGYITWDEILYLISIHIG